jgi:hypothetical protein
MEFIRLAVALIALYLFLRLLAQPFLIASRIRAYRKVEGGSRDPDDEGPDDVDPEPVLNLGHMSHYRRLGRDRFGRMIYKSYEDGGEVRYYYFDRGASEKQRRLALRGGTTPEPHSGEPRPELGWKGFDANSSPWEILGVARDASIGQIKSAYRRLVTRFHPDRFQNLSAAELSELENDTKLIHAAYAKLVKP